MSKRLNTIMSLAVAAVAGTAYAGAALAQVQAPAQSPSVDVANQKLSRNTVTINDINMPARGFVAIHTADANGDMTNRIIGYSPLGAGDHKNVKVRLSGPHKAGETMWVVVHQPRARRLIGAGGKGNIGQPYMQKGLPVDKSFQTL